MSVPIETIRTEAFSMDYFSFGRGTAPLVILPGLSVQSVTGLADAVADEYHSMAEAFRIYVLDRPRELPESCTIRELARCTALAMKALGLKNACVFGASQGGMIAIELAAGYPELVKKLVLGSASANVSEETDRILENWIRFADEGDAAALYLDFGQRIYPAEVFNAWHEALLAAAGTVTADELRRFSLLAAAAKGYNGLDRLGLIRCPVLAIGSEDDAVLGPDAAGEIAEKLGSRPDFRLHMYTGFGHASFDTAPDYREIMLSFLLESAPAKLTSEQIRDLTLEFYSHFVCTDLSKLPSGLSLVCSAERDEALAGFGCKYTLYILDLGGGRAAAAYSPKHRAFIESLGAVTADGLISTANARFRLRKMRLFIFDKEKLSDFGSARLLTPEDYPLYEAFFRETEPDADPEGWLYGYFSEKAAQGLFAGSFACGRLVTVCDAPDVPYMQGRVQHTGIMTLKPERGKGFGKQAAALSAHHLIECGVCPQWECSKSNIASIRTALSVGYKVFGTAYILEED